MKLYDFDGMFDEKLSAYVAENAGKYKESEWEELIPVLYNRFGDTKIKALGMTPREYYANMGDGELVKCLRGHLKQGVPVSEFLCTAIEGRKLFKEFLPLLDGTDEEKIYALNLLGADSRALGKYMRLIAECENEDIKDRCAELLKEKADEVLNAAVENYKKGVEREYMLEIISRSVIRSDEAFEILLNEFRCADDISVAANRLAVYGDERALGYFLQKIEEEGLSYLEFRELKFAIEALGGEYNKERDFSSDPYYEIIKAHNEKAQDIFGGSGNEEK